MPRYKDESTGTCPRCGKTVQVGVPQGGDGSARVCYRHFTADFKRCPGSRSICVEDRREKA